MNPQEQNEFPAFSSVKSVNEKDKNYPSLSKLNNSEENNLSHNIQVQNIPNNNINNNQILESKNSFMLFDSSNQINDFKFWKAKILLCCLIHQIK